MADRAQFKLDLSPLNALTKETQSRAVTLKGVRAGAKIVQAAVKARAPRVSGALRQSIGQKSAKGKRGKTLAYAVIGARKKVRKEVKIGKGKKRVLRVPAKYAHLVEKGTRKAKPHPFLRPGFDSTKDQAAAAAMVVMAAEVRKILAKGK